MKKKAYRSIWSNYYYVYSILWKFDKKIILFGILEILFSVLLPLGAVVMPSMVVRLLEQRVTIWTFIRIVMPAFAIYGVVTGMQAFFMCRGRMQYIEVRLNKFYSKLISKCLHMDYSIYEREDTRQNQQKAINSLHANDWGVEGFLHKNIVLGTSILGLIVYSSIISSVHTLIVILLLTLSAIQLLVYNKAKNYEHQNKEAKSKLAVTQHYLQSQSFDLGAGKDIRLYQLDKWIRTIYEQVNKKHKKLLYKERGFYYINDVAGIFLQFVRDGLCYGYLLYKLMHGLDVSYFVLYLGIINGFSGWFTKISETISEISRDNLMICDFRQYEESKDIFKHQEGIELDSCGMQIDIVFEHVTFRYPGSDRNILHDVSFHIKKGNKFALVGINGAGKTTIVKLICGFYQPTEGRILVNGVDTRELNIDKYFEQVAVVFQDAFTFSFPIGENISGHCNELSNNIKLNSVVKQAGLWDKISKLKNGIDTYLGKDIDEKGIQLSGGEIQKLMLARALYKDAKLLILDEPTAALDAIAESEMYEHYHRLLNGRTSLFISHRLASTRFCDYILFLENAKIKEEGTHDELLKVNGSYAEMFSVQSQYYRDGGDDCEIEENII